MYTRHAPIEGTRSFTGDAVLFVGAAVKDKDPATATRSAFKGKQPLTVVPKKTAAAQEGLFAKIAYAPCEYDDTSGTLRDFPMDKRKLGFYHRAPARGMCTRMIDTERFRSHLKHEFRHIDRDLAMTASRLGSSADATAAATATATSSRIHAKIEREAPDVRVGIARHTYDHVHAAPATRLSAVEGAAAAAGAGSGGGGDAAAGGGSAPSVAAASAPTTGSWQHTSRDVWYHPKLVPRDQRRRLGALTLASDDYGYGIDGVEVAPEHGKRAAWKSFYNSGHIEANLSRVG